jgi:sodium transport system permease protein
MSLRHVWILLCKELSSTLRDRNAILGLLLTPILSPIIYGLIFSLVADRTSREATLVLPVAGAAHAPALVQWLSQQTGVNVVAPPGDVQRAVREGQRAGVLIIGSDFNERLAAGLQAPVTLVSDTARGESERFAARVRGLLTAYGSEITSARLTLRGIDPVIVSPLKLEEIDTSAARERNGGILVFLPMLLVWTALIAGMPLALDSAAGERERGSLEPLLLNPVSPASVIVGKWLAASALGCLGLLLAAASSMVTLRTVPWHELGVQMRVSDHAIWNSVLVMLPVALLMSAAVMLASALSRSFQQAQSNAGVLMVLAIVPCILTIALPAIGAATAIPLPVTGQLSIATDLLSGQASPMLRQAEVATATLLPALLLVALAARLMRRESIIFRGG